MKIHPSYFIMAASLLAASQGAPSIAGTAGRLIAAAAVAALCTAAIIIDKKIFLRLAPDQAQRVFRSNCFAAAVLLFPFASRCGQGTWANLILDSTLYCGAVFFLAFAIASRLEPLLMRMRTLPRTVQRLFPLLLIGYFLIVGAQLASSYGAYRIEWVDFSFEFAPVWQTCHSGLFRLINEFSQETTSLAGHWPLIYALISPLTLIWKSPVLVLWISTAFFTAGAYAVYLLAKQYTQSKAVSSLIGSLYLLYLPVHLANLFDFHSDPLALPFLFLSFLFAARKQWVLFAAAMALALSCKEYVGLVYAGYGLWMFASNKKAGGIVAAVGLLWFLIVVRGSIPFLGHGNAPFIVSANYGSVGGDHGISGIARYCLAHPLDIAARLIRPNNIVAFMSMFLPFLFLPFRRPWMLAAGIFILLKDALSESGIELLSHRETLFFPFVVYAFIMSVASIPAARRRFMLCAVSVAVSATFMLQGHAFPSRGFWHMRSEYVKSAHDRTCDEMLKKVPAQASVMASSHLTSHVLTRKWYFLFPRFPTPVDPEYIVVDTLEQKDWNWLPRKEHQEGFGRIRNSKEYEMIDEKNGVFVFRKMGGKESK